MSIQQMFFGIAAGAQNNLFTWGYNANGRLGLGDTTNRSSPVQVGSDGTWKNASISQHSLVTKSDGTLWGWGLNTLGQLGLGSTTSVSTPVQVGALTNWLTPATGRDHSMVIKTNGTLWAFGNAQSGALGNNTTGPGLSSPAQIGSATDWTQVSCGFLSTYAVRGGNLYSWGYNFYGNLGTGDTVNYSSPVLISSSADWKMFSGSKDDGNNLFSMAVKTGGSLWAVGGNNAYGQLGTGTTDPVYGPTQIGFDSNWSSVSCGEAHSMAVKTNGTLWAWGYGLYNALGIGDNLDYSSPVQVGAASNWQTVCAGHYNTVALKTDGTIWGWGYNGLGDLGTGNITNYTTPVQIGSLTNWGQIYIGGYDATIAITK